MAPLAPANFKFKFAVEPFTTVVVGEPAKSNNVPVLLVVTKLVSVKSLTSEVLAADAEPAISRTMLFAPVSVMVRSTFTAPVACTVTLPVPEIAPVMPDKVKAPER